MSQERTVAAAGAGVGLGAVLLRAASGLGDDAARIAVHQVDDVARVAVGRGALVEERVGQRVLPGLPVGEGALVDGALAERGAPRAAALGPVAEEEAWVGRVVEETAPDGVSALLDQRPTGADRSVWLGEPRGTDFLVRLSAYRGATVGWVARRADTQVRVGDLTTSLSAITFACAAADVSCWCYVLPEHAGAAVAIHAWEAAGDEPVQPAEGRLYVLGR